MAAPFFSGSTLRVDEDVPLPWYYLEALNSGGIVTLTTAFSTPTPGGYVGKPPGGDSNGVLQALRPADLPSPPQAAARIVQACSDAGVGANGLAAIVASDPVLTMEILRIVNSAFFGLKREIKTAVQAVTVLGNRALRNVALCLSVRDSVKPGSIPGLDLASYWEDALRRAVGAKVIARVTGFDPEEAFTIGLLQDFGLLAMFHAMPEHAPHWAVIRNLQPEDRRRQEQSLFGTTHDQVGLTLAKAWALPAGLALPMACHHAADFEGLPAHHREACRIAYAADAIAAVYSATEKHGALTRCRTVLADCFSLASQDVDSILEQVPTGVEEAAQSLGLRVPTQPRYEDVVASANKALAKENLSYQELTWKLEQALAEQSRLSKRLEDANQQLEQLAYFDALTDLVNRRRFQEVFASEIARHSRSGFPLSFVMIDLDHFKNINDTYGHPFGDTVLVAVANVLKETLRLTDIKARIGGEEMAVLLPETDEPSAQLTVERIRAAIEGMQLRTPTKRVVVTGSLGGCTWRGAAMDKPAIDEVARRLMDNADQGLYESKRGGRNRVSWRAF